MNRKLLKDNAKIALKRNFWLVMLVVLVAQFAGVTDVNIGGGYSGGYSGGSTGSEESLFEDDFWDEWDSENGDDISLQDMDVQPMSTGNDTTELMPMNIEDRVITAMATLSVGIIVLIVVGVFAVAFATSIFFTNPLRVGYRRFFMLNRNDQGKFVDLFSSFCPKYLSIIKGMLTTDLIIFAWTLLFIIPGIIKAYQYYFVPFLLSENPEMTGERAREISKSMTDGYKFKIFVLELSFFGWLLLAAILAIPAALLTCCFMGIGAQLVYVPLAGYMGATFAELYEERREYALYNHFASPAELCGFDTQVQS